MKAFITTMKLASMKVAFNQWLKRLLISLTKIAILSSCHCHVCYRHSSSTLFIDLYVTSMTKKQEEEEV